MAYVFSALGQVPMLVVLIAGFVLVATRRARLGGRSTALAVAGLIFLTVAHVLQALWTALLPQLYDALDLRMTSLSMINFSVGTVLALLGASGVGLLIAALMSRSPSATPPPGYPG